MPPLSTRQNSASRLGLQNSSALSPFLLPLPLLAYGFFLRFRIKHNRARRQPCRASPAPTPLSPSTRKIFGHRMAQRELRRAARVYCPQAQLSTGISIHHCGNLLRGRAHTQQTVTQSRHALRSRQNCCACRRLVDGLKRNSLWHWHVAKDSCGCDEDSRIVKRLTRRINEIRKEHLTPVVDHSCSITFEIDPQSTKTL